jgi:hypothetical protein
LARVGGHLRSASDENDTFDVAKLLFNCGFAVVPLAARSEGTPRHLTWTEYAERRPTWNQVVEWLNHYPDAGIGVVTGQASNGLFAVDIDVRPDVNGYASWNSYVNSRSIPRTPVVRSPGGGEHMWFTSTPSIPTITAWRPGVDVLGHRALLRAVHHGRKGIYAFAPGLEPWTVPVATAPDFLVDDIRARRSAPATIATRDGAPATPEQQDEFVRLFATEGVTRGRPGNVRCPWHPDRHPSLSVDWVRAVFFCHGCHVHGGLRELRKRANVGSSADVGTSLVSTEGRSTCIRQNSELSDFTTYLLQPTTRELPTPRCGVVHMECDRFVGEPCKQRTCETCGPAIRANQARVWAETLDEIDARGDSIHWLSVTAGEWESLRDRHVTGKGFDYIRLPATAEVFNILTTAPLGVRVLNAKALVVELLSKVPAGEHVNISSSRRWSLRHLRGDEWVPTGRRPWLAATPVKAPLADVLAVTPSFKIKVRPVRRGGATVWLANLPATPDARALLAKKLQKAALKHQR